VRGSGARCAGLLARFRKQPRPILSAYLASAFAGGSDNHHVHVTGWQFPHCDQIEDPPIGTTGYSLNARLSRKIIPKL